MLPTDHGKNCTAFVAIMLALALSGCGESPASMDQSLRADISTAKSGSSTSEATPGRGSKSTETPATTESTLPEVGTTEPAAPSETNADQKAAGRLSNDEVEQYRQLAEASIEADDYAAAVEHYTRALAIKDDPQLSFGRAKAYAVQDQYQSAIADFGRALMANPQWAEAYLYRAACYEKLKDYNHALADYTAALDHSNGVRIANNNRADLAIYTLRASIWTNLKQFELAIPDWEAALRIDPDLYMAHLGLVAAYLETGERQKSDEHWRRVLELDPRRVEAHFVRAVTLRDLGDHADARNTLEFALLIDPEYQAGLGALAMIYCACEDASFRNFARAWELANRCCELSEWKSAEDLARLATVHAQAGNFKEAIRWQQEALRHSSETKKAEFSQRMAMYERNEPPYPVSTAAVPTAVQR